jgi:hypothetical protein
MLGPYVMNVMNEFFVSGYSQLLVDQFMGYGGTVFFCKKQCVVGLLWSLPKYHSKIFGMVSFACTISPPGLEVSQVEMIDVLSPLLMITYQHMGVKTLKDTSG